MHKSVLLSLLIITSLAAQAQRFAYVDSEYILGKLPEYEEAQKKLDAAADEWRKQIDQMYAEIEKKYQKYQAEQFLLDEDTRMKRQKEIEQKERDVKDFQKQKFGFEGDLFKTRQELVNPIQDKVFNAISTLAEGKGYDFILDKSGSAHIILYASPRYDRSGDILKALGY